MTAFLIQIDGFDPVEEEAIALRASSHNDDRVCHLDGATWYPVIAALPALRYDLIDAAFSGRIDTPSSSFALGIEPWPDFPRYALADARVRLWSGEPGLAWDDWRLRFDGRVLAEPRIEQGRASMQIAVDDRWLDTPLLATYAGTTGAEGEAAQKGQVKPLALGAPRFVPGVLINATDTIVQLSAYGEIEDVEVAFERAARFGASIGDHASYAALAAATIKAGEWATAKAVGMVRHGAPPAGKLSYHVKGDKAGPDGWVRLPGAIIKRIVLIGGGDGKYSEASLDALDSARPWPVSLYVGEQTSARDLIQRIASSVNAVAGVSWLGQLFAVPLPDLTADPALTLDAGGASLPSVASVAQIEVDPPFWRMAIEAERTWDVHGFADIAFTALLVDRGPFDADEKYREGHVVQDQGSSWLYINPTPSSNAPPTLPTTSNSWWRVMAAAGADGPPGSDGAPGADGVGSWTPVYLTGSIARSGSGFVSTAGAETGMYPSRLHSLELAVGMCAYIQPAQTTASILLGLDPVPSAFSNYPDLDRFIALSTTGTLISQSGATPHSTVGSYTTSDVIGIEHRGTTIVATKGGTGIYTWTGVDPDEPLAACLAFDSPAAVTVMTTQIRGLDGADGGGSAPTLIELSDTDTSPSSGTTETTIDTSSSVTIPAGGKFKVSGGLGDGSNGSGNISLFSLKLYVTYGGSDTLLASATVSIDADGYISDENVRAWAGKLFTNPGSGSATFKLTRTRTGPSNGASASYTAALLIEHVAVS